jgi:hypothetical protein
MTNRYAGQWNERRQSTRQCSLQQGPPLATNVARPRSGIHLLVTSLVRHTTLHREDQHSAKSPYARSANDDFGRVRKLRDPERATPGLSGLRRCLCGVFDPAAQPVYPDFPDSTRKNCSRSSWISLAISSPGTGPSGQTASPCRVDDAPEVGPPNVNDSMSSMKPFMSSRPAHAIDATDILRRNHLGMNAISVAGRISAAAGHATRPFQPYIRCITDIERVVAGRYRMERELGRGGMGAVIHDNLADDGAA